MKRPMTTAELFDKIQDILKEKGKLPDILDYGIATSKPVPIRDGIQKRSIHVKYCILKVHIFSSCFLPHKANAYPGIYIRSFVPF